MLPRVPRPRAVGNAACCHLLFPEGLSVHGPGQQGERESSCLNICTKLGMETDQLPRLPGDNRKDTQDTEQLGTGLNRQRPQSGQRSSLLPSVGPLGRPGHLTCLPGDPCPHLPSQLCGPALQMGAVAEVGRGMHSPVLSTIS